MTRKQRWRLEAERKAGADLPPPRRSREGALLSGMSHAINGCHGRCSMSKAEKQIPPNRSLKNVGEAASARQKQAKKRSLRAVNEHFEPVFNAAMATQVVFQQPANPPFTKGGYGHSELLVSPLCKGGLGGIWIWPPRESMKMSKRLVAFVKNRAGQQCATAGAQMLWRLRSPIQQAKKRRPKSGRQLSIPGRNVRNAARLAGFGLRSVSPCYAAADIAPKSHTPQTSRPSPCWRSLLAMVVCDTPRRLPSWRLLGCSA